MTKGADPGFVRGYKVLKRFQTASGPEIQAHLSPDRRAINETDARTIPMNSPSTTALVPQLVVGTGAISPAYGRIANDPPESIEIQTGLTKASRYPSIPTEHHEFYETDQVELSSNDRSSTGPVGSILNWFEVDPSGRVTDRLVGDSHK